MKGNKTWRLSRTLKRPIETRPIEQEDVKYAWAAYRKNALPQMGFPEGLDAAAFKSEFENYVLTRVHGAWTISAQTKNGFIPAGFVLGHWGPGELYMIITGIVWFPWASRRNIVEGTVAFFNQLRKHMAWMGFANREHKPLYEVCCMLSIMRRVGTSHMAGQAAVFEGRN